MIATAYLRVYLPADRAGHWRDHGAAARRPVIRASDHFVWGEAGGDDALRVEWRGHAYVCPRYPRLRMLEGVVAFHAAYPGTVLVPEMIARRAAAELAQLRNHSPEARSYILTSPWHVPLRWFLPFEPTDRELYERRGDTSVRYRTSVSNGLPRVHGAVEVLEDAGFDDSVVDQVKDLERWLAEFTGDALLELDYAGVAQLFSAGDLALDESAEEIAHSVAALAEGDYERAGRHYADVAGRWAQAQALTYVN